MTHITPVFDDLSQFTYNEELEQYIALATKRINKHAILIYINEKGEYVSDLYDTYEGCFRTPATKDFDLDLYVEMRKKLMIDDKNKRANDITNLSRRLIKPNN